MPDEEETEEEEEEEAIEEEEETDRPSNPPAASTQSESDPAWLTTLTQRLDRIDADLGELKKVKHSRPRPQVEKPEEVITGNRQAKRRKRNQRRILGKLMKSGPD